MITRAPPLTYHALLDHQRQSNGLSYQQLAERARTTASYVHRLCQGDAQPGHAARRLMFAVSLRCNPEPLGTIVPQAPKEE
jgi:transcriptional regulator with XRE-family HTH domain